jgi:hypothetical protein
MFRWISDSLGVSMPLAIAIAALGVTQLSLQIYALVDLVRRPAPSGRKAFYAAVIILAGLLGAIGYLAIIRSTTDLTTDHEGAAAGNEAARRRALDRLYGPDDRA